MGINKANLHQVRLTQAASTGAIDQKTIKTPKETKPQHLRQPKQKVLKKAADTRPKTPQTTRDSVAVQSKLVRQMELREKYAKYTKPSPTQAFQARELKTIKGVLRMWLSSVLKTNPNLKGANMNQMNQLQQLLENWLMLSRSSIEAVEKFLTVEFSHLPDNYQIFVKLQLVRLIKDAKKMLEEFERGGELSDLSGEADDATVMRHAALTGSPFGIAFVKVKKRGKSYLDIKMELELEGKGKVKEAKENAEVNETEDQGFMANVKNARELIEKAEEELKEAIKNGADRETIEAIIDKLAEAYGLIMQLYSAPKLRKAYS